METAQGRMEETNKYYEIVISSTIMKLEKEIENAVKNHRFSATIRLTGGYRLKDDIIRDITEEYSNLGFQVKALGMNNYIEVSWEV